jgi:hypothetical protein
MTDRPSSALPYDPANQGTVVRAYGGASVTDVHLMSTAYCLNEEIIRWLERREKRRRRPACSQRLAEHDGVDVAEVD